MMKFNPELAVSICDFLCGCAVVTRCCEAHGISEATFWRWVKMSKASQLPTFEWMGIEMDFCEAVQNARRLYANGLLDSALERARYGSHRRVIYQGEEKFAVRTDIPPDITDPDVLEMLYDQRDRFKRDANGHLVHLTEAVDPPVALTLAALASQFEAFQPHSSQSIEVVNRGEMGVLHVGGDKPKAAPVQIEHAQPQVSISPHTEVPPEASQRAHGLPIEADLPVDDRSPAYVPPKGSRKYPDMPVKAFSPEADGDPLEIIGTDATAATLADPPPAVRPSTPDVMLHTSVRQAMRKLHDGERGSGPIEMQIMNALRLNLTTEQRIHRLNELVGGFRSAEDRSEGLGAGPSGPKGVKMI